MKTKLYDKLAANLEKAGYKVTKDSWTETVGYAKPTREYWVDVILKEEGNTRYMMHYWFKDNKDQILKLEFWKCKIKVEDYDYEQIV